METEPQFQVGTVAYDNWRAFNAGAPSLGANENPLFSDARLTGQVEKGLGPYAFINLVPFIEEPRRVRAAFVLRWSNHISFAAPRFERTDSKRYHGGSITDEIAALASLRCGIRLRSGGPSRYFEVNGDPKGHPIAWGANPDPSLDLPSSGLVLPTVTGEHSIMSVQDMVSLPSLNAKQTITLVRAARLYQDALWLVESETNLSWLMLVGSIETAANLWRTSPVSALARRAASHPEFVEYWNNTGISGVADRVATEFSDSLGQTGKFIDFLLEHCPAPPERRPAVWGQLDWSTDNLRFAFRKIYGHRSKALHDGIPFPFPMCSAPAKYDPSWAAPAERPTAGGAATRGGTWLAPDLPMHFHTFEYIARQALNAWWSSMATA